MLADLAYWEASRNVQKFEMTCTPPQPSFHCDGNAHRGVHASLKLLVHSN
jgi:hypothetical protein